MLHPPTHCPRLLSQPPTHSLPHYNSAAACRCHSILSQTLADTPKRAGWGDERWRWSQYSWRLRRVLPRQGWVSPREYYDHTTTRRLSQADTDARALDACHHRRSGEADRVSTVYNLSTWPSSNKRTWSLGYPRSSHCCSTNLWLPAVFHKISRTQWSEERRLGH